MMRRTGSGLPEAGWITLALLAVAMAWDASALDLPFAGLAGSASGFAMRDSWLLATVLHEGGRLVAWLLAVLLCIGAWWPFGPLTRIGLSQRVQLATSTLLGALAVSLAQQWRGAHFMSHTLWSACVCWVTAGLLDAAWPRGWTAEGI